MMWFPLSTRLRKEILASFVACLLGIGVVSAAVLAYWPQFCEQNGPMRQDDSQCLICDRVRVEKWLRGEKVIDTISTHESSDWVDSFVSKDHDHVWLCASWTARSRWFGPTPIACGGVPVISSIYRKRSELGEETAQRLITEFHKLVRSRGEDRSLKTMDEFLDAALKDPNSLLQVDE